MLLAIELDYFIGFPQIKKGPEIRAPFLFLQVDRFMFSTYILVSIIVTTASLSNIYFFASTSLINLINPVK
jgi:hypothetical protein